MTREPRQRDAHVLLWQGWQLHPVGISVGPFFSATRFELAKAYQRVLGA